MVTNTQIIEDAIGDIRATNNINPEYRLLLEGTLGRELSDWEVLTIYVTTKLWQEHEEDLKLSDIAYIRTGVTAFFSVKPIL